jgi:hypothetical protein
LTAALVQQHVFDELIAGSLLTRLSLVIDAYTVTQAYEVSISLDSIRCDRLILNPNYSTWLSFANDTRITIPEYEPEVDQK